LLKINVNDHTEKKNGLTYLSWAWAWAEVLKIDPKASWRIATWLPEDKPFMVFPDGSVMVCVSVTIKDDTKSAVLPVMNHRNQAIKNPDAFAVNTAIQRCLAKAIAMHGLGLYIYAGEDLPESDDKPDESLVPVLQASIDQAKKKRGGVVQDVLQETPEIPAETKAELDEIANEIVGLYEATRELDCIATYYGIPDNHHKIYVWGQLDSKLRSFLKANNPHQKAA
jgi:hypothetical protein